MADKITLKSNSYDGRYMQLVCEQVSNGGAKNTSTIKWTLSTVGGSVGNYSTGPTEVVINGTTVYSKSRVAYTTESFPASKGSKSGEIVVSHKDDGTKSIKVSFSTAIYTSTVTEYEETWVLDPIARYGTSKQSLNSKTETSIKMNWSSDNTVDYIWYSKNNGSTWTGINVTDGKSGTYTISGLSANTTYKIKTRIRRKDSQLTTDSSALSVTTYNYPYCTSSPNFTLGDLLTLEFYNPLNRAFVFYIIGNGTQIDVEYKCSSTEYKGVNSTTSSVPYLYATIPNAKSGKYKVKVVYGDHTHTRDNGNTYSIKESECYPNFTAFAYKDTNATLTGITGNNQVLVKGLSTVTVEIPVANKMTTKNSATPKKYVANIGTVNKDLNYSSTGAVSVAIGTINATGTQRITVTAYVSRGLPKQAYKNVTVHDYAKPVINISAKRLNNFEAQTTLKVSGTYSRLTINGVDKNTVKSVQYRYREAGGSWGGWTTLTTTLSSGKFTCNDVVLSLDNAKAFEFEVLAYDTIIDDFLVSVSKGTGTLDVGQAVFFVSSNKKTAYLNGEEVATRDNVRQAKYYTQLATNTDVNKVVKYGTYRSVKQADTDTMSNLPSGINGGFTLYVVPWTSTPTDATYIRQELVYSRWTYIRASNNAGSTWSAWEKICGINEIYPVGSVYISSTNTNPASKFGGTWSLIDKGFESRHELVASGFTPATNITAGDTYVDRGGNTLRVRQDITINTALSDTGADLGTFVWSKIGITNLAMSINDAMTYRDGANGGIVWSLWSSGKVEQIDILDNTTIASGNKFFLEFTFVVDSSRMIDSFCDKFYWKRTD